LPIHGLLYTPQDRETASSAGLPMLVRLHGGPTGQSIVGWEAEIQYFVERGWLVLAPNYRGSSGYGRRFLDALYRVWGEADLEDVKAGVSAVAEKVPVDRSRVVAWGGSAGGYAVLVCLTKAPEVFRAGVDLYGLSDLVTISEQTHRMERSYLSALLGPAPDAYPLYGERSPINFADRVRGPLLLLHGEEDKSVEPAQSRDMITALERAGKGKGRDFDYHFYAGESHGWQRVGTIVDALERIEGFLTRYVLDRPG
jgi:dipeptidyl aminopeptidase/acylaminoacyl peptidase